MMLSNSQSAAREANSTAKKVDYTEWKAFLQEKTKRKAPQALLEKIKNIPNSLQNPNSSSL